MFYVKISLVITFAVFAIASCVSPKPARFVIADSKAYEASLFRQYCAICHGPEAEGRTLDDGKVVPSLRSGEFKFKTEDQIYNQISGGGNGMLPFRSMLSDREIKLLTGFVMNDLRRK